MDGSYQVNNKHVIDLLNWVRQNCVEPWNEPFKSIHFDRFEDYKIEGLKGLVLVDYSCSILLETAKVIDNILSTNCKPLIYLPLGYSHKIRKWDDKNWHALGRDFEPPSLYLLKNKEDFGSSKYVEEYKRPVKLVSEKAIPINALFTSSRDEYAMKNCWDFNSGIYLYRKEDF